MLSFTHHLHCMQAERHGMERKNLININLIYLAFVVLHCAKCSQCTCMLQLNLSLVQCGKACSL